jgi:hypothetical protein
MSTTVVVPNVRRLAQYRPFERGGLDLRAVLGDLVLAVATINDGTVESLLACRQAFLDLWGIEAEVDELRPVFDGLIERKIADPAGKGIRLPEAVTAEMSAKATQWAEVEERALREWQLAVRRLRPSITDDDMNVLREDLKSWLHALIARHGAEAALILYPEDDRAQRFFDDVDARGFDQLPEREDEMKALRAQALTLFIRSPTPDQRQFLAGLLNTSFYMTVLTIDPGAKNLVKAQLTGHRIYLDTNFLYAILGAARAEEVYSARRLVQMSRELGFEFAVTPWTMSELRTSIASSRREIEYQRRFVRPGLADAMLAASGDRGFKRLFWQTYRDKKTQPRDVFDRLEHFDQELANYGIHEVSEGCQAIEQQEERVREYASLVRAERWPFQKEPVVLEHDAKCRLLVERLRGDAKRLSTAKFWFLTYDTKLPRFAKRVPDNGDQPPELPFCVSPSTWVQIIRGLLPRTEDFDQTVVDLLTSPFVGYRRAVNPGVIQEVIGRMDHLEDVSPELAVAVLTDSAAVDEIEKAISTHEEETVEEQVRAAYSTKARELEEAAAASARRLAEVEQELAAVEARATEAEVARSRDREAAEKHERERTEAEAAAARLQLEREEWKAEKEALTERVDALKGERDQEAKRADDAHTRIEKLESRLDDNDRNRKRKRRIAGGIMLSVLGLAVAIVLPLLVLSGEWARGGAVVGGMAVVLLGVRVTAGDKWGREIVTWGGLLVAIAAIVVTMIVAN